MAKVHVVSLGCPKNLVDTEQMLGSMLSAGHVLCHSADTADVILVNTCGFIEDAKREAIKELLDAARIKKRHPHIKIVAAGCLVQRYPEELADELPEVDGFVGVFDTDKITDVLSEVLDSQRPICVGKQRPGPDLPTPRLVTTPFYTAYLKISEGCDNRCAYCAIPLIRGSMRSRPFQSVLEEARALTRMGAKELVVIAQDPTRYGLDTEEKELLPSLFQKLHDIPDLRWIRLMYAHPDRSDVVMEAMSAGPKVCAYVDLPVQHASAGVLKRMRRKGDADSFLATLERLRSAIPKIAVRTTVMVGFPGETQKDFDVLLEFVQAARFDYLGAFRFSPEEDTLAASMRDQIDARVADERLRALLDAQNKIAGAKHTARAGEHIGFLVERGVGSGYRGRLAIQAPDIDGETVLMASDTNLEIGQIVDVRVTGFRSPDFAASLPRTK